MQGEPAQPALIDSRCHLEPGEAAAAITNIENASETKPQSVVAKLMSIPMGLFFKGVAKKALLQDLNDIKTTVEQE